MSIDFGGILTRAWQITWKHKVLWIFGILAGLANGASSSGSNSGYQFDYNDFQGAGGQPQLPLELQRFADQFDPNTFVAIAIGLTCVALLIGLVLFVLSVIGRGGLIGGVQLAEANGAVTFGEAWGVGTSKFVTLFLIGLLVGVVIFLLALLIIVPGTILSAVTFGIGLLCFFPFLCVFIIVAILLGILTYFAQIAAVVENLGVMDALRRGWEIIRANVGSIIILGLILIVISAVLNFVIALPFFIAVAPALIGVIGFANENQVAGMGGIAFALICCALYLPVALVLGGILETWVTASWTLAYQRFIRPTTPGAQPPPPITA